MPATFLQPDAVEPNPNAEPGTRAFRLAVLAGYCDDEEANAILDAIEADANAQRSRTVNGAVDACFVLAIAAEALDRGHVSHHDLISALERVGIDPTDAPRDSIRISVPSEEPALRETMPDGEGKEK